jgi:hypothetical protein
VTHVTTKTRCDTKLSACLLVGAYRIHRLRAEFLAWLWQIRVFFRCCGLHRPCRANAIATSLYLGPAAGGLSRSPRADVDSRPWKRELPGQLAFAAGAGYGPHRAAASTFHAVEAAGRLFIGLTMVLPVIATAVLHRVLHGRVGFWPLCSLLFVYNAALYWGFLDFLFGLGVALLGFSGWVASERWHTITRVAVFSVVASLVFMLHLFALGIYGLLVVSYELGNMLADGHWSPKRILAEAAKFAHFGPVVLLWLASLPTAVSMFTSYGSVGAKIAALSAPMALGDVQPSAICSVLLMGLFYISWRTGALNTPDQHHRCCDVSQINGLQKVGH